MISPHPNLPPQGGKVKAASISEIFSSLQGEGTHLGERHLFVRFESCNIHCEYCDELGKEGADFELNALVEKIVQTDKTFGPHRTVSLTGGEPLLYVAVLKDLMPQLKRLGFTLYLETSGILWKALEQVIEWTDIVAMDVKPSSVTKEHSFIEEHKKFLAVALKKEVFIKMVVSKEISLQEFSELCLMICKACQERDVTLILQPITIVMDGHEDPELMLLLTELQTIALGVLKDVRIVPRLHRILKIQ